MSTFDIPLGVSCTLTGSEPENLISNFHKTIQWKHLCAFVLEL